MTLALLSGATGNPINLQRRVAVQPTRGLPGLEAAFEDFISNGGPFTMEPSEIERQVIALGGMPLGNLTGKMNLGGGPFQIGDVDPNNIGMLHFLANLFGFYKVTDNTTWQKWEFGLAITTPTTAAEFLTVLNDNDVLPRHRIIDMMMGAMRLTTSPNENLSTEFDFIAGEVDMHGLISQETGTPTLPFVKRLHDGNLAADTLLTEEGDLWVLFQTVAGSVLTIQTKIGVSAVYSNSQTMNSDDLWYRLQDEAGDRIGLSPSQIAEQILIRFDSTGTYVTLDEVKILGRRAAWSQSLTVDRPISSVNTIFILDGVEVRTEGGYDVEIGWETVEGIPDVAGRQTTTTQRSGNLVATVTPTRRLIDMTLQEALLKASTISLVIDAESDADIGASGRKYRYLLIMPECRVIGTSYGVEAGGENREESITLRPRAPVTTPFIYDGNSVDGHFNIIIENDIAAL